MTSLNVVVGIPTVTEQGALRALRLVDLVSEMGWTVVVSDNGGFVEKVRSLKHHQEYRNKHVSVAASWNNVIKDLGRNEVVLLLNDDIEVTRAGLHELALETILSHSRFRNSRGPLELVGAAPHPFAAFGVHKTLVDSVGLFDENFVPAYYEDTDYRIRLEKVSGPFVVGGRVRSIDIGMKHEAASSSRELGRDWTETAKDSKLYFEKKWGNAKRPYKFPFNKEHGT